MSKGKYIITHGLPASGKSTWAEEEVQRIRNSGGNAVRMNRDDIRTTLFGEEYHSKKPDQNKERQVTDVQNMLTDEYLEKGYTVINDDTNLNQQFMSSHYNVAKNHDVDLEQKHFNVSVEEAKRRNKIRGENGGRQVPDHVIDKMAKKTYGKDGNLKEFRLGEKTVFAYDKMGNENEGLLRSFADDQSQQHPENSNLIVAFDMDGTLADVRELADKYMSDPKKKKYHEFHMASKDAEPIQDVLNDAIKARDNGYTVYAITARSDSYAKVSSEWLKEHNVPVSRLLMRKGGDYRRDYEVKTEIIKELRDEGKEIVLAYEDNPTARAAYADAGIRVMEVPFYIGTPLQSSSGADRINDEGSTDVDTAIVGDTFGESNASTKYPEIRIDSAFGSGKCIRCGSTLKDTTKTIGDRCKQITSGG